MVCGSPEEMSHNILANADRILSILLASVFSNLFCFAITSSAVIQLLALTSVMLPDLPVLLPELLRQAGSKPFKVQKYKMNQFGWNSNGIPNLKQ